MQNYKRIGSALTVKEDMTVVANDNFETLRSTYSGTSFPTADLVVGMVCYRVDLEAPFVLESISPVTWREIPRINTKVDISKSADVAIKLSTARKINEVAFDGSTDISIGKLMPLAIAANTDLNAITSPGMYYCSSNATVATLINAPTGNAFALLVEKHAGTRQTLTDYVTNNSRTFYRNAYNGTWGAWKVNIDADNIGTYASQKITFTATDSRWGTASNGVYSLTLATGGREIVVVMQNNAGVYEQVVAGARVSGNNRIIESMSKFAGYVICI